MILGTPRLNGLVIGTGQIASSNPPWPLLVMDVEGWMRVLPELHAMNEEFAAKEGNCELERQEQARGAVALRCLEQGVMPTKEEHPVLAMRCLLSPLVVTHKSVETYAMRLSELYPGPSREPFWILDARDAVLHLVPEIGFLGEFIGPGMLSTTAPAEWMSEYSIHLLECHAKARVR